MIQRRKKNSSKINLIVSVVFHSVLIGAVFVFAAREGMLGKKLKQLTVTMVEKEKKPEPPKPKPPEPKVEAPKPEPPKTEIPAPKIETVATPAPPVISAPAPAVSAVSLPSFDFHDGAKEVETITDPNGIYKAMVEHAFLARWNRPENIADDNYVAEIELTLDATGRINGTRWLHGSGDERWDGTVRDAVSQVKVLSRQPPKGFPNKVNVRFDVESVRSETLQLSVQ